MRNFRSVLRFELGGYFKSKIYLAMTLLFVVVLMVVLSFPNIKAMLSKQDSGMQQAAIEQSDTRNALAVLNQSGLLSDNALDRFMSAMGGRSLFIVSDDEQELRKQVQSGQYDGAVILQDAQTATYIARNLALGDNTASNIYQAMVAAARYDALSALEVSEAEADNILNPAVNVNVDNLGVSQNETFFYTYILLLALYMAIMLYGQIVATSIATEKGSRTMELLITSTRPNSLLFGKIIAAAVSGLVQMGVIFGSAVLFYHLNANVWAGNAIVASIFNMPLPIVGYVLLFFLLGFSLYAFMFGAIGSLVSRVEDVSTSIMPILLIFIVGFVIVVTAMSSGNADSTLLKVCSFIPFTAPMAMFARIAMSTPAWYEIVISVLLLVATTIATGVLSATIYRMGVLMYGKPPKPAELIKVLRRARTHGAVVKQNR